jgi:CHAT domain-containing protein
LEKVQAAAAAIREEAGQRHSEYRYFQQNLPFNKIQEQSIEKPLVYLCTTSSSGLALIVSKQGVQAIEIPELKSQSLQKQIWRPSNEELDRVNSHIREGIITPEDIQAVKGGYFSTYALWSQTPYLNKTSDELMNKLFEAWKETLDETTSWLWDVVMGKLISVLKEQGESAVLIPIGQLSLLPLHAAWTEDLSKPTLRRYVLDELNISYVPSAHSLWQASLATKRPVDSLVAVDNPDGLLFFSGDEVKAVLSDFDKSKSKHLSGKDATVNAVRAEIQKANVLHFATHGRAGWDKAEQAQLLLADGVLTVPDIFNLDLHRVRLAVLSGSETGLPGLELLDEMIGLPAGMLQAGVPGVIGPLWTVSDMSTAMLMARFYSLWREKRKERDITPQEALRQAQIWLRDSTTSQKMEFFDRLAQVNVATARNFYNHLAWNEPDARIFESPFFWAAFTYTGA